MRLADGVAEADATRVTEDDLVSLAVLDCEVVLLGVSVSDMDLEPRISLNEVEDVLDGCSTVDETLGEVV